MSKINLQMYSFMDGLHNDSRENLALAAELGYDGVELFGPDFQIPAAEMKAYLAELGLEAVSMHAPTKEDIIPMIPYAKELGIPYIGLSMEVMLNDGDVHRWAKELNEYGDELAREGLMMIYHNHTQEFAPCEGKRIIDVLLEETNPETVGFELDAGWCAAAGYDPIEHVQRYAGRIKLIHVKESSEVIGPLPPIDIAKAEWVDGRPVFPEEIQKVLDHSRLINCHACEGLVDWTRMKEAGDAAGVSAYIVEREYSAGDRVEELRNDLAKYRAAMA